MNPKEKVGWVLGGVFVGGGGCPSKQTQERNTECPTASNQFDKVFQTMGGASRISGRGITPVRGARAGVREAHAVTLLPV